MKGLLTRQEAIAAKCKDCVYDVKAGGTWKQQVTACSGNVPPLCPLYDYRPTSSGKIIEYKDDE